MEKVKVVFVKKMIDGNFGIETIWCNKLADGNYEVQNIPFVVDRISLGDIISAELDEEDSRLYFEDFVSVSGNSTVMVYLFENNRMEVVRAELHALGCDTEAFVARSLIAINVPKNVNYGPVKSYLDGGETSGIWTFEEACLEHQ